MRLANAVANAILANGGTISDAINAVANTIINAGGSAAQVGSAIGTIVNANSAAAGGQTAAQLAWNYVAGQPGGTLTTAQQIIIVANAGRGAGASVTDTLSQIGSVINGAGGSANQVAAVVGQAGTALGATTEQLNAAANNIMNNVYGTTTNSSTFQAAVQYYAGNNSNAITGGDASTLGTIGSNGSGVPSLNGTTTATSGGTFSSGITGSTGTVVNTGGSAVNGIVTGGTYIVGAATGSSTSGSTSGSGSSLSDAGDAIAGILGSAGISSTSTVNGIIGRIGTGTGLSAEDSSALGSAIDSASSSIDLSGSSGSGSGSSGSGGSSGSSGSSSSGSSGSSGSSSSSSSGTPVTCNSVNIDRSKYNYCDDRTGSYKQVGTGDPVIPSPPTFPGACLLGVSAGTAGACGDRQYRLALQNQCGGGTSTEIFAQPPNTLAARIDSDGYGCCAYNGPGDYTDTYKISCRRLAGDGGQTEDPDADYPRVGVGLAPIMKNSSDRGLTSSVVSIADYDRNNSQRDFIAYRSDQFATVTRKMNRTSCSMDIIGIDWSQCERKTNADIIADGNSRWWWAISPGTVTECDPDGSGAEYGPRDGYRPYQIPYCVASIYPESGVNMTDGKFGTDISYRYDFTTAGRSTTAPAHFTTDQKYRWKNCVPKDLYAWSLEGASLAQSSVDRVASLPVAGAIDSGRCTVSDVSFCQVSVGAGKYDTYRNCKCELQGRLQRRMNMDEMIKYLKLDVTKVACAAYPPE
jgi:hypothetical protein